MNAVAVSVSSKSSTATKRKVNQSSGTKAKEPPLICVESAYQQPQAIMTLDLTAKAASKCIIDPAKGGSIATS